MRLAYYGSGGLLDGLMQGLLVRIKSAIYIYIACKFDSYRLQQCSPRF